MSRSSRGRASLPRLLRGALRARGPASEGAAAWGAILDGALERRRAPEGESIWAALAAALDPGEQRPRLAPDVEVREFGTRWGGRYGMIGNPRDFVYYPLEPWELDLLLLIDGSRTVREIVVDRLREGGDLDSSRVADLVRELRMGGFLHPPSVNTTQAVRRALEPGGLLRRTLRESVRTLSIEWRDADRLVRWSYRWLRWCFSPLAVSLLAGVAAAGLAAFAAVQGSGRFSLGGESPAAESLILLGLCFALTFAHELGHALVLTHYGRRVKSAGFMLYFGSPAFFVDASDGLMLPAGRRIVQASAGSFAELVIAGVASLAVWAFPGGPAAQVLYTFCVLNYFVVFMNLVPLLELDGYFILSDLLEAPDLRPRSLAFLREDLWRKLRHAEPFRPHEAGLALYGLIGVAFTIFTLWVGAFFWWEIFGGLVTRLWQGGIVTRVLLAILAAVVAGPAIRGGIAATRTLGRRARALARRIRFRVETHWRVEAAELIDALPLFDHLPEEVLNDLAGRVRLRTVPRARAVVRQGERAEAFYVVRRGSLQVVEEHKEHGTERALRILGRGESFGELGLADGAPRRATVRTLEDSELFEIDKGTFDRLLADTVRLPSFAPTVQEMAQLHALPCFAHLGPDELAELLAHGRWVTVAPGEVIIEQGEEGEAFYATGSGRLDVLKDGVHVRTMGPGDHFGEIALLRGVPRTATVQARTPARVFRLDREGFHRIVARAFRRGTLRPLPDIAGPWQH